MLMKLRTIQFSSSLRSRPRMNVGIRAGTTRDRDQRHAEQGEALGERQRMEQLPLAAARA